ncbi:MAG: hypothetical protein QMC67_13215 [Candidatus Wallbacteria bacterium]
MLSTTELKDIVELISFCNNKKIVARSRGFMNYENEDILIDKTHFERLTTTGWIFSEKTDVSIIIDSER